KMIAIPGLLIAVGGVLLSSSSQQVVIISLLLFGLYQAWHFGAQNIGVSSFISIIERGKGLRPIEKTMIKCGIITGMMGVLHAMRLGVRAEPSLGQTITMLIDKAYFAGFIVAIPVTGIAFWLALRACRDGKFLFGISFFQSVTFLFAMYLSNDFKLGF